MTIVIHIKRNNIVGISISRRGEIKDSLEWKEDNNLSRTLLANLDEILRKNKLSLDKISGYKIISEVPRKWTTYRIAEITFRSLMIAARQNFCSADDLSE